MDTIKRQIWAVRGFLSVCAGLSLQHMGCTPALSVTQQRRCSCSCRLWRYISVKLMLVPFMPYTEAAKGQTVTDVGRLRAPRLLVTTDDSSAENRGASELNVEMTWQWATERCI